jgi:hypothetical protein
MTNIVLMTYTAELPWAAAVARELRPAGYGVEAWVFDERERALAISTDAFDTVVNVTAGFRRSDASARLRSELFAEADRIEMPRAKRSCEGPPPSTGT